MPDETKRKRVPYFGDYVLFAEIGRGATGVVYDAQQTSLDRPVALKILHPAFAATETGVQRLRLEAEAAARLDHPNIVPIYEIGAFEGQPYLAMQLVEGQSLAEQIAGTGPLAGERDAAALMVKIARAVHYAHERGVLHRDLKPGNILIDESGEPHLIDFGLAKCLEEESGITQTGAFLGTPAYMSPEQARGQAKLVTLASDVYSLGAILYALLAGRPPFVGESVAETIEQVKNDNPPPLQVVPSMVARDLETICLKCLEKEPARRYGTALELAEDLQRFLDGWPILAREVGLIERAGKWVRRKPIHAALWLAALLLCATSVVGVLLWGSARSKARENETLLELGSRIAVSRTGNPRKMSWSENIQKSLAPDRVTTHRPYYRDQIASTLEGLDARLQNAWRAFRNEQLVFNHSNDTLLAAGMTNAETWWFGARGETNSRGLGAYPGKPIAFPAGVPLQIVQSRPGKLLVWMASEQRALCELESATGLGLPGGEDPPLSAISSESNLLVLMMKGADGRDALVSWGLPSGKAISTLRVDRPVTALAVSPDGSLVAYGDAVGQVRVLNSSLRSGARAARFLRPAHARSGFCSQCQSA